MTKYRVVRRPGDCSWLVEQEYVNWRGATKRHIKQTYYVSSHWDTRYESREAAEEAVAHFKWQDRDKGEVGDWV